jgi:hypothetical protein
MNPVVLAATGFFLAVEILFLLCGILWKIAVVGFLALWFFLSVLYQFRRRPWRWLRRWDPLRLVPRWTFFAPDPGGTDLHLAYRAVGETEAADSGGEWIEIPLIPPRGLTAALWHPARRGRKVLLDAVRGLFALAAEVDEDSRGVDPRSLQITVPYLVLLQVVAAVPKGEGVTYRQFQITESHGFFTDRASAVIFRSEVHAV